MIYKPDGSPVRKKFVTQKVLLPGAFSVPFLRTQGHLPVFTAPLLLKMRRLLQITIKVHLIDREEVFEMLQKNCFVQSLLAAPLWHYFYQCR